MLHTWLHPAIHCCSLMLQNPHASTFQAERTRDRSLLLQLANRALQVFESMQLVLQRSCQKAEAEWMHDLHCSAVGRLGPQDATSLACNKGHCARTVMFSPSTQTACCLPLLPLLLFDLINTVHGIITYCIRMWTYG